MVVSDSLHESGVRERLNLTFLSEVPLLLSHVLIYRLLSSRFQIEPRLLRSSGPVSAQPVYVVGIYKDKTELVGQSKAFSFNLQNHVPVTLSYLKVPVKHWRLLWTWLLVKRFFDFGE